MRLFLVFFLLGFCAYSQRDSTMGIPLLGVHFGAQIPGGDMAKRFGSNLDAGASFLFKTSGNWVMGLDADYMFGSQIKENVLEQITNSDGFVTDNEGYPADVRLTERGIAVHAIGGRLFPFSKRNLNSGLLLTFGAGYLTHKIHIYDAQQKVASLSGDLRKGYDRSTSGLSISQFIGYMYIGKNRLNNFYFGFQFYEAFTQSRRKLNYSDGKPDTAKRLDLVYGFRVAWILPLYKKTPNDFYVY